jgi:hypothetical protein
MGAEIYRKLAQQIRDMIQRARTEEARAQLRVWVGEFEAEADAAEKREENRNPYGEPSR